MTAAGRPPREPSGEVQRVGVGRPAVPDRFPLPGGRASCTSGRERWLSMAEGFLSVSARTAPEVSMRVTRPWSAPRHRSRSRRNPGTPSLARERERSSVWRESSSAPCFIMPFRTTPCSSSQLVPKAANTTRDTRNRIFFLSENMAIPPIRGGIPAPGAS